uniref:Putative flagellar filament outer layer protein FlaA n=1 Tax=uncultured bacterium contig00015 TaxID=1181506 RepID=A0A806KSY8_9BACT|nr:putative flagellar filament outer layer protein FlaA [uncultured bacterium contig00015]
MVFPAFGDTVTSSLEAKILESFNGDEDAKYLWKAEASRFASKVDSVTYPVLKFIDASPAAVYGYNRPSDAPPVRSLGINGKFDRNGYNWIDIYPVLADDPDSLPAEIHVPGRVRNLDLWVWGSNYKYYIEVFLRDYRGVIHTLRLGDISYQGWRNLNVNIPSNIIQARRTLPSYAGLTFVKFRIWTQPTERVDDFYIYFKNLKILTDTFETQFDGNDLADPAYKDSLWAN